MNRVLSLEIEGVNKLKELLSSEKSVFCSIECTNKNSYIVYDNICQYIKKDLGIHVCFLDTVHLFNCTHIPIFLKNLFLDFLKYIKRKKIYVSVLFLPYFDDWFLSIKEKEGNEFLGEEDENNKEKTRIEDIHRYIYNVMYYLRHTLVPQLSSKFKIKCIGFINTPLDSTLYDDIFDHHIKIKRFVRTYIVDYHNVNKKIGRHFLQNTLSLQTIYNILDNNIEALCGEANANRETDLFKCSYTYYSKNYSTPKKKKKIQDKDTTSWDREYHIKNATPNFQLLNMITCLKQFHYLKKYKYLLRQTKWKRISLFLLHSSFLNIRNYLYKKRYSYSFLKAYIDTLQKKHVRLSHKIKPLIIKSKQTQGDQVVEPIKNKMIPKKEYKKDNYNVLNVEEPQSLFFYFTKCRIPNTLLICGASGMGKTTLLKFIVHMVSSNYNSISFSEEGSLFDLNKKVFSYYLDPITYGNSNIVHTLEKMHLREKKKMFYEFQNVRIFPFKSHLLINKSIGENSKYIKNIFVAAFKNQPSIILFDNIDFFLEKNDLYPEIEDKQHADVYKNIYMLLIHYLNKYVHNNNKIKFIATSGVHPKFLKFSFLRTIEKFIYII